jgi:hypothetical protein
MVKKDYRIEIAGMGYPINTPSQKARAREMMRVSRIRVVSVYARTPPSSFYSLTGRKFRAERPAGRRTVAAVRPNGAKMHTVRPIPGHGMRAAIVPTDDAVVYVTALRRAAGAELGNYIRDVYPVLSSEARSLRDKIAAAGEHEAVDIRAEIPRDGGWATNRVHHGKYVRPNGACRPAAKKAAPKRASRSNGVRSPSYPYLVVERMTGRVHAGAETRNDAEDMRHDLPTPAADLQTLTREGVRRKFGRISWASVATMRNGYGKRRGRK